MNLAASSGGFFSTAWGITIFVIVAVAVVVFILEVNYRYFAKTMWDEIAAFICLIVMSPVYLCIAIAGYRVMKKHGGGKILERHIYLGKHADRIFVTTYALTGPDGQYLGTYADFLKKSHFVHLPMMIDVLCGRLSFIGPHLTHVRDWDFIPDEYNARFDIRPGILTPLAFGGRADMKYEEVFEAECRYAEKREMFKDAGIMFKTLALFIRGESSNVLGEARERDYCEVLMERGSISAEDYESAGGSEGHVPEGTVLTPVK